MIYNHFSFIDQVNNDIKVYQWMPEGDLKAIVQIAHGMTETALRYEELAIELTKKGYGVYINDHIGHGRTAKCMDDLGHFEKGGFNLAVENLRQLSLIIQDAHKGIPLVMFGHSMGSFFTQAYLYQYGDLLKGCILSGTAGKQIMAPLGALLAKTLIKLQGERHRSKLLDQLSFGGFNKPFEPSRTPFDWLSRDPLEVDKYIEDPYCGFLCTNQFYYELFMGIGSLHHWERMKKIPTTLPIYIFCGDADPVGGNTKTVKSLIDTYRTLGIKDLTYKFYPSGRHEMLKEVNRQEVIGDIIHWLGERFS